jgi:dipeptidase
MHVRGRYVSAASMIAELPDGVADGAPLRAWLALGSPCATIYVPAFPRSAAGPPPFVPFELSSEELWQAADAVRRRVEDDPDALVAVRDVLDPVEDELWSEADEVLERPERWAATGASWGARVLDALGACIH